MKKEGKARRLLAAVMCMVMIFSVVDGGVLSVYAAEGSGSSASGQATEGVDERWADYNTMETYQQMLLGSGESENSRYAGRLWADKSVVANSGAGASIPLTVTEDGVDGSVSTNNDFLHVFSLLGSSQVVNEFTPADLVLALDISGSMASPIINETADWVNTVDPDTAASMTSMQGLGYYTGNGGADYNADTNGIPDAIVAVLPTDSNAGGRDYGLMSKTSLEQYNRYLTICNTLVDGLVNAMLDDSIDKSERSEIETAVNALPKAEGSYPFFREGQPTIETLERFYKAYTDYRTAAKAVADTDANPWLSDAESGRNAIWPCQEWIDILTDVGYLDGATNITYRLERERNPLCNNVNSQNRMYYVMEAANSFISQYLKLNPKNRISVVVYDSVATVLMPLAHYEADGGQFLSAVKHHWQAYGKGQWASTVSVSAKPTDGSYAKDAFDDFLDAGGTYKASVTSWGNTDTEAAITAGMDILAQSFDAYDDLQDRIPIMILMTDGAANVALTGSSTLTAGGSYQQAWMKGAAKSTTTNAIADRFNQTDGMGLDTYKYNELTAVNPVFQDKTTEGLTVYGAGAGHIYGGESNANSRYTVLFQTLMGAAYQKTLVEKHYNNKTERADADVTYPTVEAEQQEWTKAMVYTIGFGVDGYGTDLQAICNELLNPKESFLEEKSTDGETQAFVTQRAQMNADYKAWRDNTAVGPWNMTMEASNNNDPAFSGGALGTVTFPLNANDLEGDVNKVTKNDIDRNIRYNTSYYIASMTGTGEGNNGTLSDVFDEILREIRRSVFIPVGGENDAGARNSVTYTDPIGQYMEVKDVTNLVLFGQNHPITKTAVYDWDWNNKWMLKNRSSQAGTGEFPMGWYHGEDPETATGPSGTGSWENGDVYRVGFKTAQQFLPTLTEVTDPDAVEEKTKQTEYTFYRLDYDGDKATVRSTWRVNPAFAANFDTSYYDSGTYIINDPTEQARLTDVADNNAAGAIPDGVYRLSDIRIWVEDSGDYIYQGGNIQSGGFAEALRVDVPASAMPMEVVTINAVETTDDDGNSTTAYTYSDNLDTNAAKPLRVFYSVGVQEDILLPSRNIDVGLVDDSYVNAHQDEDSLGSRTISRLYFLSNYYSSLQGDASITFSPSSANRFYIFQKNLALYTAEERLDLEHGDIFLTDPDSIANVNTKEAIQFRDTTLTPVTDASKINIGEPYYIVGEYYVRTEDQVEGKDKAELKHFVLERDAEDFGTNVTGEPGVYLSWYNPTTGEEKAISRDKPDESGNWVVAAKVGGFRAGNLAPQTKASQKGNLTGTADYYYFPQVSASSSGEDLADSLVMNLYMGNNGKLNIEDTRLLVTKQIANSPEGAGTAEGVPNTFTYQAYVDDPNFTGTVSAIKVRYDVYSGMWRQRVGLIEALTDNEGFLMNEDGTARATYDGKYIWVGNGEVESTNFVLFNASDYGEDDIQDGDVTIYYDPDLWKPDESSSADSHIHYAEADDAEAGHGTPEAAGTRVYWTKVKLFDKSDVDNGVVTDYKNDPGTVEDHFHIAKMVLNADQGLRSGVTITSEYNIRTTYLTEELTVGSKTVDGATTPLTAADLFDQTSFKNHRIDDRLHEAADIAAHTVQFTLADGEGLEFTGLGYQSDYRVTEQITKEQADAGYDLLRARVVQYANFVDYVVSEDGNNVGVGSGTKESGNAVVDGYYEFTNNENGSVTNPKTVTDSQTGQPAIPNNCAYFNDNGGVYSLYGDTDTLEEAVHYVNYTPEVKKTETNPGDKELVNVGDKIEYEIRWENQEQTGTPLKPTPAVVVVTDQLDPGVDFVSASYNDAWTWTDIGEEESVNPDTDPSVELKAADDGTVTGPATSEDLDWDSPKLGDVEIEYNADTHTVTWTIWAAENQKGAVKLKVQVNEDAEKYWKYGPDEWPDPNSPGESVPEASPSPTPEEQPNDNRVYDRAEVKVANHHAQRTEIVENPVWEPEKIETQAGGEIVTDDNSVTDPETGTVTGPGVQVGDDITYRVSWNNVKTEIATITVTDQLDPGVDYKADTAKAYIYTTNTDTGEVTAEEMTEHSGVYTEVDRLITWNLGQQEPNAAGYVEFTVTVNDKAVKDWQYTESIDDDHEPDRGSTSIDGGAADDNLVRNKARVIVDTDSYITNEVDNPTWEPEKTEVTPGDGVLTGVGEQITYRVSWKNYHTEAANIIVTDQLDVGVDYDADTAVAYVKAALGAFTGDIQVDEQWYVKLTNTDWLQEDSTTTPQDASGVYTEADRTLTWKIGGQAPGTEGFVQFSATVNDQAKVYWNEYDPAPDADPDQPDYQVLNQGRVKVGDDPFIRTNIVENPVPDKTETTPGADETVSLNQQVDYSIHWQNDARDDEGNPKSANVIVTDQLDPGVDFVSASFDGVELKAKTENDVLVDSTNTDADKGVTISYNAASRTVTWTLLERAAGTGGDVTLSVKVNDKANWTWDYAADGSDPTPDESVSDNEIHNKARVEVDNVGKYTNEVDNPLWEPHKTETAPGAGELVGVGDTISYQVTWRNYHTENATVTVTDRLDPGVDYTGGTAKAYIYTTDPATGEVKAEEVPDAEIGYDEATRTITWALGEQAPKAEGYVTFDVTVNDEAMAYWNDYEPDPAADATKPDYQVLNQAGVTVGEDPEQKTEIIPNPVPGKTETAPGEGHHVRVGDSVTYQVHWRSDARDDEGNPKSADVIVTDLLDPGVNFVSASFDGVELKAGNATAEDTAKKITIAYDETTRTVTWTLLERPAGTEGDVTLVVEVNDKAVKAWDYNSDGTDGALDENSDDEIIHNQARVQVDNVGKYTNKVDNPLWEPHKTETAPGAGELVQVGEQIDYRVTWKNYHSTAAAVTVFDRLDPGVDYVDGSAKAFYANGTEVSGATVSYADHQLTWALGDQEPGVDGYVTFSVTVNASAVQYWNGYAEGTGSTDGKDYQVLNQARVKVGEDAEQKTEIIPNPVPAKEETAPGANMAVGVGDTVDYEVYWKNGKSQSANVVVTDQLDPGVNFVSAGFGDLTFTTAGTTGAEQGVTIAYDAASRTVTWTLQDRPADSDGWVKLTVEVNEKAQKQWDYTNPNADVGADNDNVIHNRARVAVDNKGAYTTIVDNPLKTPAKVSLYGRKAYTGGVLSDNMFTFTLTPYDGNPTDDPVKEPITVTNSVNGAVSFFTDKDFYKAGTYRYSLLEQVTDNGGHVIYDTHLWSVTVAVSSDASGSPQATIALDGATKDGPGKSVTATVDFNNVQTEDVSVIIEGVKELVGGELEDGQFTFELSPVGGWAVDPAAAAAAIDDELVPIGDMLGEENDIQTGTGTEEQPGDQTQTEEQDQTQTETETETYTESGTEAQTGTDAISAPTDAAQVAYSRIAHSSLVLWDMADGPDELTEAPPETQPTAAPTEEPAPTVAPTEEPAPTVEPEPTVAPTEEPAPTTEPTEEPTEPTAGPTEEPTEPTTEPTTEPVASPEPGVSPEPDATPEPSATPDPDATPEPEATEEPEEMMALEGLPEGAVDLSEHPELQPMPDGKTAADSKTATVTNVNNTYRFAPLIFSEEGEYWYKVREVPGSADKMVYDATEYYVCVTVTRDETAPGEAPGELHATVQYFRGSQAGEAVTGLDFKNAVVNKTEPDPGDGTTVTLGQTITYHINWINDEDQEATVNVRDPLDVGVDYVSSSPEGHYDAASHTVYWVFQNAAPRSSGTIELKVKVNAKSVVKGQVDNQAHVRVNDRPEWDTDIMHNYVETGRLTIQKTVAEQGDRTKDFTFTLTLTDRDGTPVEGTFGYIGSKSGTIGHGGSLTLKHNEWVTISGLPVGTHYTVTESGNDGYTVTKSGEVGDIQADQTARAEFVNELIPTPGPEDTPTPTTTPTSTPTSTPSGGPGGTPTPTSVPTPGTAPHTGDPTMPALWLAALTLSLAGVCIVCGTALRRRRRSR